MPRHADKRSSTWGAWSLVCVALTPITCGVAALPAVVLACVGLRRDTHKSYAICGLAITAALLLLIGCLRHGLRPYTVEAPLTLAQARHNRHISQQLPETASNIWVFSQKHGPFTYDYRLRFEAPVADCMAYARMLVARDPRARPGWIERLIESTDARREDHLLAKIPWFDAHTVNTGVVFNYGWTATTNGPSIYETIWVDQAKGVLYYFSGD